MLGLNSDWFFVVADGHQSNSRGFMSIIGFSIKGWMNLFPIKGVLDTGSGLEEEEMVWNSHLPSLFCRFRGFGVFFPNPDEL